jgi:hypothetical protein
MTADALASTLVAGDGGEERESLGVAGDVGCEELRATGPAAMRADHEHHVRDGGDSVEASANHSRFCCCGDPIAMMPVAMTSAK